MGYYIYMLFFNANSQITRSPDEKIDQILIGCNFFDIWARTLN